MSLFQLLDGCFILLFHHIFSLSLLEVVVVVSKYFWLLLSLWRLWHRGPFVLKKHQETPKRNEDPQKHLFFPFFNHLIMSLSTHWPASAHPFSWEEGEGRWEKRNFWRQRSTLNRVLKCFCSYLFCRSPRWPTAATKQIKRRKTKGKKNGAQDFVIKLRRRLPRPFLVSVSVTVLMLWEAPLAWHGPPKLFLEMGLGKVKEARGLQEMVSAHWGVIIWICAVSLCRGHADGDTLFQVILGHQRRPAVVSATYRSRDDIVAFSYHSPSHIIAPYCLLFLTFMSMTPYSLSRWHLCAPPTPLFFCSLLNLLSPSEPSVTLQDTTSPLLTRLCLCLSPSQAPSSLFLL